MEFRILGPLDVLDEGNPVSLGRGRERALLALLLTRPNEVVSVDRLIDELWSAEPPKAAVNTVQYYVSRLRKALGADRIVTRPPGYAVRVEPGELDLERFERLLAEGSGESVREALALWRGPPLADFAFESFAQPTIGRLEELRLVAVEQRVEADLTAGRHAELVAELETLVVAHPLRERLRGQLMLALYRSGRQAEALEAYQAARHVLVDELGLEPSPALQDLERAILRQDPSLGLPVVETVVERSIVVAVRNEADLGALLAIAEPLAARPPRELILIALVDQADRLPQASAALNERRTALGGRGLPARSAAFTTDDAAADLLRLAVEQSVDLVLLDGSPAVAEGGVLPPEVERLLAEAPCDVALAVRSRPLAGGRPVLVPFGGAEHDWAAVEVGAWAAAATDAPLRLLGTSGGDGRRDASRLLASASLLVQRAIGLSTEPVLVEREPAAIVAAAAECALVVAGLSDRWRTEGLGETRLTLARDAEPPALLVKRGLRPSGVAPEGTMTRFTWSLSEARRRP
jgi:DNA-binding SARP family transcriptional activator